MPKLLVIVLLVFNGVSCSNSDDSTPDTPTVVTFTAKLMDDSGYYHGDATLSLDQTSKICQLTVNHDLGNLIVFEISNTSSGDKIFEEFDIPNTSPIKKTFTITDAQIKVFMANQYSLILDNGIDRSTGLLTK